MDQDTILLREQQELLRQIRDELRSAGATGGATSHGGGGNAAYSQFRTASDHMASASWATGSWANAYKSQIAQGAGYELLGSLGLARSPNTMTQLEYEMVSAQQLGVRVSSLPGALLAPSFNSTARSIADEIYSFSPRFARFGDSMAGATGAGMSFGASRQIARDLSVAAAGDLRMSGKDYSTVMSTGLASGQFDQVRSTEELTSKFNQLKDTIGDLSRVTRMTVSEMSTFMGGLRQAGVMDIGDQRRITENLSANARVAGVALGDMIPGAMSAVSSGLGMGLSAGTSAGLYGANMAAARTMSRSGVVSANLMAQAGGASGYAAGVTAAQQGFLASTPAMLAMAGGGGNFLGAMTSGLGSVGGSLDSILAMQLGSADMLEGLSAGDGQRLVDSYINQQAELVGGGGVRRQAVARQFYLQRTGNAGLASAAARRYSDAGMAAAASDAFSSRAASASAAALSAYDDYYVNASTAGAWNRGLASIRGGFAGLVGGMENALSPGQTGFLGFDSTAAHQLNALNMGVAVDSMTPQGLARALANPAAQAGAGATYRMNNGSPLLSGLLGGLGGLGGAALGASSVYGLAAALPAMLTPPGLLLGGLAVAAGAAGVYGGALAGGGLGGVLGAGSAGEQISAEQYNTIQAIRRTTAAGASQAGREALQVLSADRRFQNLAIGYRGRDLSGNETSAVTSEVAQIAAANGMSREQVAAALTASGSSLRVMGASQEFGGVSLNAANKAVLSGLGAAGNFQSAEASRALAGYLANPTNQALRGALLQSTGATVDDLARLDKNIGGFSAAERQSYSSAYTEAGNSGDLRASNQALSGLFNYLDSSLSGGARASLQGMSGDKREMLKALSRGGSLAGVAGNDPNIQRLQQILNWDSNGSDKEGLAKAFGMSQAEYSKVTHGATRDKNLALAMFLQGVDKQSGSPDGVLAKAVNTQHQIATIISNIVNNKPPGEGVTPGGTK